MDKTLEMRPSTPSVRVIDLGWQGSLNPSPLVDNEDEGLVDEYLSLARLVRLIISIHTKEVCLIEHFSLNMNLSIHFLLYRKHLLELMT